MTDSEGLIGMLEGAAVTHSTLPPSPPQQSIAAADGTYQVLDLNDAGEWFNDPVPTKLEKIRAAFLNSKTAAEVAAAAGNMPVGMWLECVIKLMPKDIKVQGEVGFRHMLEGLGPIDPNQYRLGAPPQPSPPPAERPAERVVDPVAAVIEAEYELVFED